MNAMADIRIEDDTFRIGGVTFHIDNRPPPRRSSEDGAFTIVKTPEFLSFYAELATRFRPRTILELGIYQGGSFVFIDKLFDPLAMAALDIAAEPVAPLVAYCEARPRRTAHFRTSQSDAAALQQIVTHDLGGTLDMVIDDASHAYGPTRASFLTLFPLLAPAGLYIVEDWAWAHWPGYQGPDAPRAREPALTSLLFEQIVMLGSIGEIDEVVVRRGLYVIRKSGDTGESVGLGGARLRGHPIPMI